MPRPRPPLDALQLTELALGYAARFSSTRVKTERYLVRKLRERGWADTGEPPVAALLARLETMGAIDDRAWGQAKADALARRGYGRGRVAGTLMAAGVALELRTELLADRDAHAVAEAYARRRRLGRFAAEPRTPDQARRDMGAMMRAGHGWEAARRALAVELDPDD